MHAPVRALEGGAHPHLPKLQLREQRQQAERGVIGDVRRVEAAEALPLPQAELAVFQEPRAFDDRAQMAAPAVRVRFGKTCVIEQPRERGGLVEHLRMLPQKGVRVRGSAVKGFIVMAEPPAVFGKVIREIPGQNKPHRLCFARGKAHRAAERGGAELFRVLNVQAILPSHGLQEGNQILPVCREGGPGHADPPQNGRREGIRKIGPEQRGKFVVRQRLGVFGDGGRRRADLAVRQTARFAEAEKHGFLTDAEVVVVEDVFPDEAPVVPGEIALFAVAADAEAHRAAVRRVGLLHRAHRDADGAGLRAQRVPAAVVVAEFRHQRAQQAHRQRFVPRVFNLEIQIEARRGGKVRAVRHKRRDRPPRQPAGQGFVLILQLTHGEPPVKTDRFHRLVPGERPIGEIVRLGFHAELSHGGTPTRLLCPDPERQSARVAFAVVRLAFPADPGHSGRVGNLPIVELAVGHELDASGADAAQRDPAAAGLGHDDPCHNETAFLSDLSVARYNYSILSSENPPFPKELRRITAPSRRFAGSARRTAGSGT